MTNEQLCRHEAGHACAAALLGLNVQLLDTITRYEATPGGGLRVVYGVVRHSGGIDDRDSARRRMIVILCGPLEGAESWDEVPSWPLSEDAPTTDEYNLWALADWLGLDEADYREVFREALALSLTSEYRILHQAVTGLLDYVPRLDPGAFEQVRAIVRGG
jgi:hypothetical protein